MLKNNRKTRKIKKLLDKNFCPTCGKKACIEKPVVEESVLESRVQETESSVLVSAETMKVFFTGTGVVDSDTPSEIVFEHRSLPGVFNMMPELAHSDYVYEADVDGEAVLPSCNAENPFGNTLEFMQAFLGQR